MHQHSHSKLPLLGALLAALLLPLAASAQVIELAKITDEDTPIRGWGDSPALRGESGRLHL